MIFKLYFLSTKLIPVDTKFFLYDFPFFVLLLLCMLCAYMLQIPLYMITIIALYNLMSFKEAHRRK